MTFWLVFALMTAAAVFAVLWPLSKRAPAKGGTEVAVYRDQLDEIAHDHAAGLIGEPEAEAARIEISRRLLAAAQMKEEQPAAFSSLRLRRATALAGLLLVPALATGIYLSLGSPQLPGEPLSARLDQIHQKDSIATMIAQVEAHLERNPDDARGWQVIAPIYLRMGRFDQAVAAQRRLLALEGESADRDADLGEALTAAANGMVTDEAKASFDSAAKLDPEQMKAQFFLGLAAQQDGNKQKAAGIWNALLAKVPPGAAWADTVREALAEIGAVPSAATTASGPDAGQIASAAQMNDAERHEMIRGMVARLASKLKDDGNDVEGWQRLLRAYVVLGDRDKAHAAAIDAKKALGADQRKLSVIEEVIKSLGLEG